MTAEVVVAEPIIESGQATHGPKQVSRKPRNIAIGSLRYKAWVRAQYRRYGPKFRHEHLRTRWLKDHRGNYLRLELEVYSCEGECFGADGERL